MRSVVVLILCTYFWIYLRPPQMLKFYTFGGGAVSLLEGRAPPGVWVIPTLNIFSNFFSVWLNHALFYIVSQNSGSLRFISHNFTSSQALLLFLVERDLIQFSLLKNFKKFFNWLELRGFHNNSIKRLQILLLRYSFNSISYR